jgi:hypothetical protein
LNGLQPEGKLVVVFRLKKEAHDGGEQD